MKVGVTSDGEGLVSHAGSALLAGVAEKTGLARSLSSELGGVRRRRGRHDPGRVIADLAVMLADGGDCLSDLRAMRDQAPLFGQVASASTAFRLVDAIASDPAGLERLRSSHARARARVWKLLGAPSELTIDVDATLIASHSEKDGAAGNFKGGYGHHPLLCYLDETGEAPAGILRPGNAGSNTASDHVALLDLALAQLDPQALEGEILVRGDGAGATHELTEYCREGAMGFSFGFDLSERVREAIPSMSESAWVKAIRSDGTERER